MSPKNNYLPFTQTNSSIYITKNGPKKLKITFMFASLWLGPLCTLVRFKFHLPKLSTALLALANNYKGVRFHISILNYAVGPRGAL